MLDETKEIGIQGELRFQLTHKDKEGNHIRQVETKLELEWVTPEEAVEMIQAMQRIFKV